MKICVVEWDDANTTHGWADKQDLEGANVAPCVSCGILAREDEREVVMVLNLGIGIYSESITIPRGCIKRIRRLKINEKVR